MGYKQTCNGYMYGHYIPKKLYTYVKEFKCNETTTIENGVSIRMCPILNSNDDSKHNFIPSCEGEYLCHKCNKKFCLYIVLLTLNLPHSFESNVGTSLYLQAVLCRRKW